MRDRDEWMRRLGPLYPAAVALRRTTAIRWPAELEIAGDDLVRSAPWMVALGAAVGLGAWSAAWLVARIGAAPALGAALALAAGCALGAAQLEIGVARRGEQLVAGAGVVAVVLLALVRAVALLATATGAWMGVLIAAPLVGRWAALLVQRLAVPPAPALGDRDLVVGVLPWPQVGVVTAAVVVVATLLVGWAALAGLALAGAAGAGLHSRRDRGPCDAEVLALAAAAGELALLVCAAAAHPAIASPFVR